MATAKRKIGSGAMPTASAYEASWRRLHPARAAEERTFRKDRADREKTHAKFRAKAADDITAETRQKAARRHQGSLARLYELGHLTIDQLAASQEIKQVAERIGADVRIGSFSLETRVDQCRSGGTFFEALGAVRAEVAYSAWRQRPGAAIILAMIMEDLSLTDAARLLPTRPGETGMRKALAKVLVGALLDGWVDDVGEACRGIDKADLLAMQAGLF